MNAKQLMISFSLSFALTGMCLAAAPVAQGTLAFSGSIVESNCASHVSANARLELANCPFPGRALTLDVRSIESGGVIGSQPVRAIMLADKRSGRYYDQPYQLVDNNGSPIRSGNYLITLTAP